MEGLICRLRDGQALAKLVGESPVLLEAVGQLPMVAKSDAAVLLTGETGTGKELVARAIHYLSDRAGFPFVPVNCGSLPDALLENELFGHERGAFTDAHARSEGLMTQADRGTLFLDEIDSLSLKAQVALLRVLQDKRFRPVGASVERHANVRIVAATNVALRDLIASSAFRPDLYYRLCVFSINLPPLRDRREDILLLAAHFLERHTPASQVRRDFTDAAGAALVAYDWPGNVRELENVVIRGIHLSRTDAIEPADLGLPTVAPPGQATSFSPTANATPEPFQSMKQRVIEIFERDYLTRLMHTHSGNVTQAARVANKERRDLGRLLKKYRLDPKDFRRPAAEP